MNFTLKLEVKEKWLEALRSGEYKQGQGCLRDGDNNFCCLGVLCDIHAKETNTQWIPYSREPKKETPTIVNYDYMDMACDIPSEVRQWAVLKSSQCSNASFQIEIDEDDKSVDPRHYNPNLANRRVYLADMNDSSSHQLGFEEIANLIERYL